MIAPLSLIMRKSEGRGREGGRRGCVWTYLVHGRGGMCWRASTTCGGVDHLRDAEVFSNSEWALNSEERSLHFFLSMRVCGADDSASNRWPTPHTSRRPPANASKPVREVDHLPDVGCGSVLSGRLTTNASEVLELGWTGTVPPSAFDFDARLLRRRIPHSVRPHLVPPHHIQVYYRKLKQRDAMHHVGGILTKAIPEITF